MRTVKLGVSNLEAGRLAYGCWRLAVAGGGTAERSDEKAARNAVMTACEAGYTLFDHSDVYSEGVAESLFGRIVADTPGLRDRILIATKGGIRRAGDPGSKDTYRFDFSADHLVAACEGSLKRLQVETIDLYQLHRADYLMDPGEVAGAFSRLKQAGKVRWFGVCNFRPPQVTALQVACPMPITVHQVEISLGRLQFFEDGTLEQCQVERLTPMAWSPLAGGQLGDGASKLLPGQRGYRVSEINAALDEIAAERGVSRTVIAYAWLLKHPVEIMPIVGSTRPERIREAVKALDVDLTREEWYRLLAAARSEPLP